EDDAHLPRRRVLRGEHALREIGREHHGEEHLAARDHLAGALLVHHALRSEKMTRTCPGAACCAVSTRCVRSAGSTTAKNTSPLATISRARSSSITRSDRRR